MNMLENIIIVSIQQNITKFKVTYPTSREDFFNTLQISKSRKKYFILNDAMLYPNQTYTIITQIDNSCPDFSFEPVDIVYEDDLILITNKPCNLLVHNDGQTIDTLNSRVNAYALQNDLSFYPLPIHRIDKDTSGLVLFSKHPLFHSFFDMQISEHIIQKEYLAVVEGSFPFKKKEVHFPISRDRHNAKKMILSKNGKSAHSFIKKIKSKNNTSLLSVQITTGRKHQIRVHLNSLGFPIINDELYGSIQDHRKLLLQSHQVTFYDPIQKKSIVVQATIDPRFNPYSNNDLK